MKRMWILIIAALMVVPAMAGVAAAAGHSGSGADHNGHNGGSADMYRQRMHHGLIGEFQYNNGMVVGKYVNFTVNPRTGEISDYSVNNVTVFTSIDYKNGGMGKIRVSGAKFFYLGAWEHLNWSEKNLNGGWRLIQALDTPVGILHILTHGSDVITYTLAPGINATLENSTVVLSGKVSAYIFVSNGNVSVGENRITVTTGSYMDSHGRRHSTTSVLFMEPRNLNIPGEMKKMLMREFERGKIGGEMYINAHSAEFVNYTSGLEAKLAMRERNHIRIDISAEGVNGSRVIMINIENGTLNLTAHHKLVVKFDGKVINETTPQELFNGGYEAKYSVVEDNGTMTLLLYVPHFSEHTLDVESEPVSEEVSTNATTPQGVSNPMLWIGVGIVIIAIIVVAAWRVKSR
ncbi:hypothetical protein [Aciduliprofundum sp. MAR08-339]|uniref:hypothetical protein n=1 Tax=Aciduliprofundum sp. (strain MAR08-339) TaxID=673860 RepID=UPI000693BC5B